MRIALVSDASIPGRTSAAIQLWDLSHELVRQGHEVTLFLPSSDITRPWSVCEFDGIKILRLRAPKTKDLSYGYRVINEWLMPHLMKRNLRNSPFAYSLWEGVIWYSPSIFHAPFVKLLKSNSRCSAYLILRDIFPDWAADLGLMRRGIAYRFLKGIAQQQYALADTIGVQSPNNLTFLEGWKKKGAHRQLEVLNNWLGKGRRHPCRIQIEDSHLAGRKIFVYAGNIGVAQGLEVFIDLAKRLVGRRDIGFLFVGRGSEAFRLKALVKSLELDNVAFEEEVDPTEIPDLYAQCYAGIVSLDPRHRTHNIPGKLLSYLQNGLPVLANVNEGNDLADLILAERIGEVCQNGKPCELERRFRSLMRKIALDPEFQSRCRRVFEKEFSVEQAARQIVSALETTNRSLAI
jgi:glycosyltransferase involved in cell wall biosynthesis